VNVLRFFRFVAGNVALTFDARGGIYIAGGISPRIVDFMRRSQFRHRFEAKAGGSVARLTKFIGAGCLFPVSNPPGEIEWLGFTVE
jgi:glucokinase